MHNYAIFRFAIEGPNVAANSQKRVLMTKFNRAKITMGSTINLNSIASARSLYRARWVAPKWLKTAPFIFSLAAAGGVAQAATKMQINVDKEPGLCEHFRRDLEADHVASMTRNQLCEYSFEEKHGAHGYFEKLGWQPMPGDPVALTMKIFEANVPPHNVEVPANVAKDRAHMLAYADAQNEHHALVVEMAPYTRTQLTLPATFTHVHGYILRSRGSYCGSGSNEVTNKRSELIAFFADKELTRSMPISGSLVNNVDEPTIINGKYYVLNLDDGGMWGSWFPPGIKGSYSLTLSVLQNSFDNSQLFSSSVCSYTYLKESK